MKGIIRIHSISCHYSDKLGHMKRKEPKKFKIGSKMLYSDCVCSTTPNLICKQRGLQLETELKVYVFFVNISLANVRAILGLEPYLQSVFV